MIDYYTYWAQRRAERWEARCDWLMGWPRKTCIIASILGLFKPILLTITVLWLALAGFAFNRFGKATDDFGKAVENMRR